MSPDYLRYIHKFLFQDLYEWAGKYRTVRLHKATITFAYPGFIEQEMDKVFKTLQEGNQWRGIEKERFSHELAVFYTDINIIHPFRDGNGRSIRKLLEDIAINGSFYLTFHRVRNEEYAEAMARSVYDPSLLESLLYNNLERL